MSFSYRLLNGFQSDGYSPDTYQLHKRTLLWIAPLSYPLPVSGKCIGVSVIQHHLLIHELAFPPSFLLKGA